MPDGKILGCDVGGTFTDFFLLHDGAASVLKVRSTPGGPEQAVVDGLRQLVTAVGRLVHGSTVGTNAVLERRGARTALITTAGFRDLIEIGRQARPRIYAMEPRRPEPLVPRERRFEVVERVLADGTIEVPLSPGEVVQAVERAVASGAEALAASLLFSFLHPAHEQAIAAEARRRGLFVSASSEVLPEYREYERTSTTVVNAYIGPVMSSYLERLAAACEGLGVESLEVMQSSGGVFSAQEAGRMAAHTVLSGPAGGVAGAFHAASSDGYDRIISFDMGGTSTDVALCDGELTVHAEATVEGLPVRLPAVDVHTVGAGGGSVAWMDSGGSLRVGPQSAGADPGPAAYGRRGPPTVTDAHAVLGHLPGPLAGKLMLDRDRAAHALAGLGAFHGPEQAAEAVLAVVGATMERALRVVSLERGHDPRDFTLLPFGGAGPLHACQLAEALGIRRIMVPAHPGVLSAVGMALAPPRRELPAAVLSSLEAPDAGERLAQATAALEATAAGAVGTRTWFADLRYRGQAYELRAPLGELSLQAAAAALAEAHRKRYGFVPPGEPEIVNLRLVLTGSAGTLPPEQRARTGPGRPRTARIYRAGAWREVPLLAREHLRPEEELRGPAIITQYDCTTILEEGWRGALSPGGALVLEPAS